MPPHTTTLPNDNLFLEDAIERRRFSSPTLLKQCKTVPQVLQLHAQSITTRAHHLRLSPARLLHALTTTLLLLHPAPHKPSTCPLLLLRYALSLFSSIPNPTVFSYNTLIRAHTLLLLGSSALLPSLRLFRRMRRLSIRPDSHSFPFLLKAAAASEPDPTPTRSLHAQAIRFGFSGDLYVVNSLIRGYSRWGLGDARKVFDECPVRDVVSWNSMIDGLVKAREMGPARELFDKMPERDSVSWATLISGYVQGDYYEEAVTLFCAMMDAGVRPENVALVSALSACGRLGDVEMGREVHDYIERNGIRVDSFLATGLVDFYAKCGLIDVAIRVFESSRDQSLFTWNAMLVGLAMHGRGQLLLDYFARMVRGGVKPDGISFLGVLVGCSHGGLVNQARRLFKDMECVYGVTREAKHYGCMSDLLARSGKIEEAMEMIRDMPTAGDMFVWSGLLGGCRIHGNVEVAERAAKQVMQLKPEDGGVYSILADVYAKNERWDELVQIRRFLSSNREVIKKSGYSRIRSDGLVHEFLSSDRFHSRREDIFSVLNGISLQASQRWIARRITGTAAYSTAPSPDAKPYMPETDDTRLLPRSGAGRFALKFKSAYMPVYISLGLIMLQMSIGLYTVKQHLAYSPAVRVRKSERKTVPEVTHPEKVVDEANKFVGMSFYRKVAHVQEFNSGMQYLRPSLRKDVYANHRRARISALSK